MVEQFVWVDESVKIHQVGPTEFEIERLPRPEGLPPFDFKTVVELAQETLVAVEKDIAQYQGSLWQHDVPGYLREREILQAFLAKHG